MRTHLVLPSVALLFLAGCTSGATDPARTLTVFAAASLSDVFPELGERLEDRNPGLEVRFAFAGSATLAAQLVEGAAADVIAAADERQMQRLRDEDLVPSVEVFAENSLVLAVPADDPRGAGLPEGDPPPLSDLVDVDMTVAVCAPEVPCGAAAAEVLEAAGLSAAPDTYEDDVRAVLTKVQLGEVDAGLVYRSDVQSAGDTVLWFAFREAPQAVNRYPVGVLAAAAEPAAAQEFVDLVLSDEGQRLLADAGFLPPS